MAVVLCLIEAPDMSINGKPCPFPHRSTSIFRREQGQWRLVHHQTDFSQDVLELCGPQWGGGQTKPPWRKRQGGGCHSDGEGDGARTRNHRIDNPVL